jgi:outer membrane receptor for ferrienterochelin and colicins
MVCQHRLVHEAAPAGPRGIVAGVRQHRHEAEVAGVGGALAYTYLEARDAAGERLPRRPRHSATLRLDWQHDAWRAGLRVEHQADRLLPAPAVAAPPERAPSITLVGAHLMRRLPLGFELTLGVDNLTDVRLAERSPLFAQAEPPRTWRATLRGSW